MKTVIDAVNEFKADINNAPYASRQVNFIFESNVNNSTQSKGELVVDDENHSPSEFRQVCTIEEFLQCVREMMDYRPEPKPIYTQAMADNGELPLAGMECLASVSVDGWFKFRIDYMGEKYVIGQWFDKNREASFGLECVKFKPLTPPKSDEEKAFDRLYIRMTLEMERRFELSKINNHSMVNDDTQVGVEFAIEYMRKNINIKVNNHD